MMSALPSGICLVRRIEGSIFFFQAEDGIRDRDVTGVQTCAPPIIMLMSVTERTREIGIRKSLGATRRAIRRQFLAESVTLSLVGGVLGLAAGMALAGLVAAATPLPARVTAWSVGVALSLGLTGGVVFGVYPATRAARLDPITALRAE